MTVRTCNIVFADYLTTFSKYAVMCQCGLSVVSSSPYGAASMLSNKHWQERRKKVEHGKQKAKRSV